VRDVLPSVRAGLDRLVRIPSVSADPAAAPHLRASAGEVAALLRAAGLPEVEVPGPAGGQPAAPGHPPRPPRPPPPPPSARRPPCPAVRAPRCAAPGRRRRLGQRPVPADRA